MNAEEVQRLEKMKTEPIEQAILYCMFCQKPELMEIMSPKNMWPHWCSIECEKLSQDQETDKSVNMGTPCNHSNFSTQWESTTSYYQHIEIITTCIVTEVKYCNK